MALSFANQQDGTSPENAERLAWRALGFDYAQAGPASDAQRQRLHAARLTVRQALRHIAERRSLPPRVATTLRSSVSKVTARLDYTRSEGLRHIYGAPDIETGAALGVALLADSDLARRLRQCSCEAFFLAEGRRSAARYCSTECSENAERQKAAARQRRLKARQREQEE